MFLGLVTTKNISFLLVFLEGLLSFFSPCIIPLIPVYMSYLAGNTKKNDDNGEVIYERKKVFLHTVFFVLGISFSFFILGMTFTALGKFFNTNKYLFTRIGGILIIVLGLFQLGVLDFSFLQKTRKMGVHKLTGKEVNPLIALVMGFTFSFAWTPCVGPMLSSVLIMASGAKSAATGNLLVFLYALGFVIPFLLLGLFTARVLGFLHSHKKLLKYTIKAGGIILIVMGIMTYTGWMNGISGYLNSVTNKINSSREAGRDEESNTDIESEDGNTGSDLKNEGAGAVDSGSNDGNIGNADGESEVDDTQNQGTGSDDGGGQSGNEGSGSEASNEDETDAGYEDEDMDDLPPIVDFTLTDQYGNEHTLSDYKGKVVFLNFWASWCGPCKKEMPHIEELYKEYNLNQDEIVILGVANPRSEEYPNSVDGDREEVLQFLEDNNLTFPTLFDETGDVFMDYFISSYPTTFMINKDGKVLGYIPGMMEKHMMISVIEQTLESTEGHIEE